MFSDVRERMFFLVGRLYSQPGPPGTQRTARTTRMNLCYQLKPLKIAYYGFAFVKRYTAVYFTSTVSFALTGNFEGALPPLVAIRWINITSLKIPVGVVPIFGISNSQSMLAGSGLGAVRGGLNCCA